MATSVSADPWRPAHLECTRLTSPSETSASLTRCQNIGGEAAYDIETPPRLLTLRCTDGRPTVSASFEQMAPPVSSSS